MGRTESSAPGCAPEDEFDPLTDDFVSKERKYLHFDLPLSEDRRDGFFLTQDEICNHSFWPLLAYESVERRVKKSETGEVSFEEKARPIKFASHFDAALLEYYTKRLSRHYEDYLKTKPFDGAILAYRAGVGDNISHAKALFDEVRECGECTAIAVDISGFFDNIDHPVLMSSLQSVLSCERLPDHDFTVFGRMSKFSWVESDALKARLGSAYAGRGRICTAKQFRELVRPKVGSLVNVNLNTHGIPQGTPLSGLYANISMLQVDAAIYDYVKDLGGTYRRYSDDIAIVIPGVTNPDEIVDAVGKVLNSVGLSLSGHKTETSQFSMAKGMQIATRPFQYLGFTFDGSKTLIRASSLNRFYAKMHSGVRAKVRAAKNQEIPRDEIYLRELYRRYTHFGKSRNFPRYAYRASRVLDAPEIRSQLSNHMKLFRAALRYYLDRAYG